MLAVIYHFVGKKDIIINAANKKARIPKPGAPAALPSPQDVQVPVCPLCNTPVPVRRGEMPDVVVGEHIDRDCRSDPAQRQRKIFTNKCLKPGCKQKEMMKVICEQCHKNYCLKHRHPLDHDCTGAGRPLSKAG
uniref:AN1-type domain-containing protein n=1 Tax=Meleagris gallopavo TaxID=9103 RepID=G1NHZ9_MELGA